MNIDVVILRGVAEWFRTDVAGADNMWIGLNHRGEWGLRVCRGADYRCDCLGIAVQGRLGGSLQVEYFPLNDEWGPYDTGAYVYTFVLSDPESLGELRELLTVWRFVRAPGEGLLTIVDELTPQGREWLRPLGPEWVRVAGYFGYPRCY